MMLIFSIIAACIIMPALAFFAVEAVEYSHTGAAVFYLVVAFLTGIGIGVQL